ncbi:MAG: hypothetical protein ACR2MP_22980 [Streptosporangiaceae bacterium]
MRGLGPEPLGEAFTAAALGDGLARHAGAPVKAVLLNQAVVAGIGSIYADESLHHARIHPARPAGDLSRAEVLRLHGAIQAVLAAAIATGGTGFASYVNDFRGWPATWTTRRQSAVRAGQARRAARRSPGRVWPDGRPAGSVCEFRLHLLASPRSTRFLGEQASVSSDSTG